MEEMRTLTINGQEFEVVDDKARTALENLPIKRIESTDMENLVVLRNLESGSYILYGRFKPYEGATSALTFATDLQVSVKKSTSSSEVQVFYPVNNCVQHLKITDTDYTRTNVYLNNLVTNIGDLSELQTTDKTSIVAAINELKALLSTLTT